MNFYTELENRKKYQEEHRQDIESKKQEIEKARQLKISERRAIERYKNEVSYYYYREFIHTILPEMIQNVIGNDPEITEKTTIYFNVGIQLETNLDSCPKIKYIEYRYKNDVCNHMQSKKIEFPVENGHVFLDYITSIPNIAYCMLSKNLENEYCFFLNLTDAINFYYGELQREEHYKPMQLTKTYHEEEK